MNEIEEPAGGQVIRVGTGEGVILSFRVRNESDQVARFAAHIENGAPWITPHETDGAISLGPGGSGRVRVVAAPPPDAPPGNQNARVVLLWDGEPDRNISLIFEIFPGAEGADALARETAAKELALRQAEEAKATEEARKEQERQEQARQEQAERATAERIAHEKAEVQAERERDAAEQAAEAVRVEEARKEAERQEAARQEAEQREVEAKAEAERQAQEKSEAEAARQTEEARQKADADAKAEAERQARERTEREQTELEEAAREATERQAQEREVARNAAEAKAAEEARLERERLEQEQLEKERLKAETEAAEEQAGKNAEAEAEARRLAALEAARQEAEAKAEAERRTQAEEKQRQERARMDEEERKKREQEQAEAEEKARLDRIQKQKDAQHAALDAQKKKLEEESARREAEAKATELKRKEEAEALEAQRLADELRDRDAKTARDAAENAKEKTLQAAQADTREKERLAREQTQNLKKPPVVVTPDDNSGGGRSGAPFDDTPARPDEGLRPLKFVGEPVANDPSEAVSFPLEPGKSQVFAFPFKNDQKPERERGYILDIDDELRRSDKREWAEIIRGEVNLLNGQEGALYARVLVPESAEPGEYDFGLLIGPRDVRLTPRRVRIGVRAVPAVRLTAKDATVVDGPFLRGFVDFPLTISPAGNSDTAFRISVVDPEVEIKSAAGGPSGASDVLYESRLWRYHFDRELENIKSPGYGQPPAPASVRLRVQRRGPWWFGFKETHKVHVRAVPVTDPLNNNVAGNELELTASRWRLTPFPPLFLIPLFLILLPFLVAKPSALTITNATYVAASEDEKSRDRCFIVGDPAQSGGKLTAKVKWNASYLSPTSLISEGATVAFPAFVPGSISHAFTGDDPKPVTVEARATNLLGSGDAAQIIFLNSRTGTPLEFVAVDDKTQLGTSESKPFIAKVMVPKSGLARLGIQNTAKQNNAVVLLYARKPSSAYSIDGLLDSFTITQGETRTIKIKQVGAASDDEIILVTSDKSKPLLRIALTPEK